MPAVDAATFGNAYRETGRRLEIAGIDDDKADVRLLVKTALSQTADNWLLIVFGAAGATPLCDGFLLVTGAPSSSQPGTMRLSESLISRGLGFSVWQI